MVVGTVVTVLAAYLPARRASKVAPIAAMRDVAVDSSGHSRRRAVIGTVLTGLGAALLVDRCGWRGCGPDRCSAPWRVFAGVVVLGPVVGPRFVRLVGAPVAAFRGMTGVLARDNAARNPKRTAATASALMIGVALVVLISVFATSARSSIDANIDTALRSDWVITPLQQDGLSPTVAQAVDALPETASVTTFRCHAGHARRRDGAGHGDRPRERRAAPRRRREGRRGERARCEPDRRPAADRDEEPLARRRRRDDDLRRDRCAALHRRDDLRAPEPARRVHDVGPGVRGERRTRHRPGRCS